MDFGSVNYLAVLIGGIASLVVGFVWFLPQIFGNQWMQEIGKTQAEIEEGANPILFAYAFAAGLILALMIALLGVDSVGEGIQFGVIIAIAASMYQAMNFIFEGRSRTLWLIYFGYALVLGIVIGAILGAFG